MIWICLVFLFKERLPQGPCQDASDPGTLPWVALLVSTSCSPYPVDGRGPLLEVEPESVELGVVAVPDSASLGLELFNAGGATLRIESISASPPFVTDGTSADLVPNESLSVLVTFQAEEEGSFSGSLQIISDDPDRPDLAVPLHAEVPAP